MHFLHRPHRALSSAISLTGLITLEYALVVGVLLALPIEPV